ncbi:MAG: TonB-dependent receptor [Tannerella sp.]|jgi:TonB-linked SusC/RagA family outer membrane protein|nr:TonB-dependent receptor [Tannerella sp.]
MVKTKMILVALSTWLACLAFTLPGYAQTKTVAGVVTDEHDEPVIGAAILVVGTSRGTVTDVDGRFSFDVPANAVLQISYMGYVTQRIRVGTSSVLNIKLEVDETNLDEVVVIGYGTQRKATLTGAISAVKNEEIIATKNESVVNMLTGKLPGVRIAQKSSQPGDYDTHIDIRGMGTPLFVVDGIPRDKDYFFRMDPEEIESISVLKDGSAAIYGLRAANGVMLITTKSGTAQDGKVDITYTGNQTFQQFLYVPEGVSATEYMTLRNEQNWQDFGGNYLIRRNPVYPQDQFDPYLSGEKQSYNWMDAVFKKTTPQQQHNLSVNGGSEKLRYFFNLGYGKQEGSYRSGDLYADRWNIRTNVDAQITSRLKARVSLGAILTSTHKPNGTGWTTYKSAWLLRPDASIYANDNPLYLNGNQNVLYDGHNMVAETDADYVGYELNKQRRLNGTMVLTYDIPGVKGLSAKASYDYTLSMPDNTNYRSTYKLYVYNPGTDTYAASEKNTPASVSRSVNFNYNTNLQAGLNYSNTFDRHSVNGLLLFEETYATWESFNASRELMINSEYLFAGEDKNQKGTGGEIADILSQSLVGRVGYDFGGKYMADFQFRYDGSSKFPEGSRWGFFPSVSAGWRISEEAFVKDKFDWLNNLKLRASYGEMGDDGSARNYPSTYVGFGLSNNVGWYFDNTLNGGVNPPGIPNPKLTWYAIKMYNAGVDFQLWKGLLGGALEIYRRDRSGLLATSSAVIPGTVGASLPQENLNSDRSFGWEISLEHRNKIGDFNYFINPQVSATKQMRTYWLETPAGNSYDYWRNRTSGRYDNIWWGNESGGMFTSYDEIRNFYLPQGQGAVPGDWWNMDWNEDGVVNGNDDHPIASRGLPVFNYGISTGGSWRNFDLTMNFQGAYGVYVQYAEVLTEALAFGGQNTLTWFMDRWRPEDPNADYFNPNTKWIEGYYPVTGHDGRRTGTNSVQDASYMRLKTLELGYSLPKKLVAKAGIKNLRIYLSGYNLLTFTGLHDVDPERPGSAGGASTDYIQFYNYPINRTYTVGASIKF